MGGGLALAAAAAQTLLNSSHVMNTEPEPSLSCLTLHKSMVKKQTADPSNNNVRGVSATEKITLRQFGN